MIVLQLLIILLLIYLIFCFLPSVVMFRSIFFLRGRRYRPKPEPRKDYYLPFSGILDRSRNLLRQLPSREVSITGRDGTRLVADYYEGGHPRTVVAFHGFRSTPMSNCAYLSAELWKKGYNLLLVHHRAHGKSDGRYSTVGLLEQYDVLDWVSFAAKNPSVKELLLYGVSMGATALGFASDKIQDKKVRAMILDCGFNSCYQQFLTDCQKKHIPWWTVLPLLRIFYRIRFGGELKKSVSDSLKNTGIPAVFLHGTTDSSVTFSQGEANFNACASEKEAIFLPGADHTCTLLLGGEQVLKQLFSFLEKYISTDDKTQQSQEVYQ